MRKRQFPSGCLLGWRQPEVEVLYGGLWSHRDFSARGNSGTQLMASLVSGQLEQPLLLE